MNHANPSAYDVVLYPSNTHPQTHPDRLAAIGAIFGMQPAPLGHCRVLELGCGDGVNLIAMAFGLRDSQFEGIDLAAKPITKGQAIINELGLRNIQLRQGNVAEPGLLSGRYDYIIAHGLYSWVPEEVRDRILALCHEHLAGQGIAYVSYAVYPGSHLRDMVREMMLYHTRHVETERGKVEQAVALVRFLARALPGEEIYQRFLREELEDVLEHDSGHLYHDELASINVPLYFHQFMAHAARHDLQFVGEADFYEMQDRIYSPETHQALRGLGNDRVTREQYLDFLKCRRFRQTLLCHGAVSLQAAPNPQIITRGFLSSAVKPVSNTPAVADQTLEKFQGKRGAVMSTDFPLAKAAMVVLGATYPESTAFSGLLKAAAAMIRSAGGKGSIPGQEEIEALTSILWQAYANGLIEMNLHSPAYARQATEKPLASPLARCQLKYGSTVTNLRHSDCGLDDALSCQLLSLLDGTRDRPALLRDLKQWMTRQLEAFPQSETVNTWLAASDEKLAAELERNLKRLAQRALLLA